MKHKIKKRKRKGIINYINSPAEIPVPCWNIFVCQSSCDIKHDDSTLSMNTANQKSSEKPNVRYKWMKDLNQFTYNKVELNTTKQKSSKKKTHTHKCSDSGQNQSPDNINCWIKIQNNTRWAYLVKHNFLFF